MVSRLLLVGAGGLGARAWALANVLTSIVAGYAALRLGAGLFSQR
jgi:hypothetical protein